MVLKDVTKLALLSNATISTVAIVAVTVVEPRKAIKPRSAIGAWPH